MWYISNALKSQLLKYWSFCLCPLLVHTASPLPNMVQYGANTSTLNLCLNVQTVFNLCVQPKETATNWKHRNTPSLITRNMECQWNCLLCKYNLSNRRCKSVIHSYLVSIVVTCALVEVLDSDSFLGIQMTYPFMTISCFISDKSDVVPWSDVRSLLNGYLIRHPQTIVFSNTEANASNTIPKARVVSSFFNKTIAKNQMSRTRSRRVIVIMFNEITFQ